MQRDEKYYLASPVLVFQVEKTLFRIPAGPLIEVSTVFKDMLSFDGVDGQTDDSPILLSFEKSSVFSNFLDWVFPGQDLLSLNGGLNPAHHPKLRLSSRQEWEDLFYFSRKFQIESLEQLCLSALASSHWDGHERLQFAQKNNIPLSWASRYFETQTCLSEPMTLEQVQDIGIEAFTALHYVRQKAQQRQPCTCNPRPCTCAKHVPERIIKKWIEEAQMGKS